MQPPDRPPTTHPPSAHPEAATGAAEFAGKPTPAELGIVYLVGAGPGDPGLLTLRGQELLRSADCVLFDGLAHPDLLEHAPQAEQICVGKHGTQQRHWSQEEITRELIERAANGQRVVRLKGGDPAIFARTGEEVAALAAAKIPFEIVPGITAALAASAYAGIPLTDRRWASAVALITGHEEPSKHQSSLDWSALAKFPGTLVVYMGVTQVAHWTSGLLTAGMPRDTAVAIVRHCSWPDQQTLRMRLDEVSAALTPASRMRPPLIAIVGPAAESTGIASWFEQRPLFHQTVLVTRPAAADDELVRSLQELGANVVRQPVIQLTAPLDWTELDQAIDRLKSYRWIVFNSAMGVRMFCERLWANGRDARALHDCRIACVGPGTAVALRPYGLRADLVPSHFDGDSLALELRPHTIGQRVLWVRASRGRDAPLARLSESCTVDPCVAYQSQDVETLDPAIQQAANSGSLDWVTVTSSASARSLARLFGDSLRGMRLASLNDSISRTLFELGYPPTVQAATPAFASLAQAIAKSAVH